MFKQRRMECVAILWSHKMAGDYHDAPRFLNGDGETGEMKRAFSGRKTLKDLRREEDRECNF